MLRLHFEVSTLYIHIVYTDKVRQYPLHLASIYTVDQQVRSNLSVSSLAPPVDWWKWNNKVLVSLA